MTDKEWWAQFYPKAEVTKPAKPAKEITLEPEVIAAELEAKRRALEAVQAAGDAAMAKILALAVRHGLKLGVDGGKSNGHAQGPENAKNGKSA